MDASVGRFGGAYSRERARVDDALRQFPSATLSYGAAPTSRADTFPTQHEPQAASPRHSFTDDEAAVADESDDVRFDASQADEDGLPEWVERFDDDGTCPCGGALGAPGEEEQHYVWMAFLDYDNDEEGYRRPRRGRDYRFFDVNYWTSVLSRHPIFHCQMFFWHQYGRYFITFSIDAHADRVWVSTKKTFSRGWRFVRLRVSREREMVMYNFFVAQVAAGKPFNGFGSYMLFVRPIDTQEDSWFCSQLDVAALQRAGFLEGVAPHATTPAELYRLIMTRAEFASLREETENPVVARPVTAVVGERYISVAEAAASVDDDDGARARLADRAPDDVRSLGTLRLRY